MDELFRPQDKFSGQIFALRTKVDPQSGLGPSKVSKPFSFYVVCGVFRISASEEGLESLNLDLCCDK